MITQLPVRRIWLHVRQLRDRVKNKSTRKTEDELIECTTSQADGIEDAMIDGTHNNVDHRLSLLKRSALICRSSSIPRLRCKSLSRINVYSVYGKHVN